MAPSHRRVLMALLVALAVSLQQPSAAAIRIPPIFPCIPSLPKIPFLPCYDAPPREPLTDCWTPLTKMIPCAGFFTNSSVSSPPGACCDGFQSVVNRAGPCFCHYSNGDIGQMIPGTLNFTRMFALPAACGSVVRLEAFTDCVDEAPPMTRPSPPPSSLPPAA